MTSRCAKKLLGCSAVFLLLLNGSATAKTLEGYYTEEEVRYPSPGQPGDYVVIRKSWYAKDRMRKEEEWMGVTVARFDLDKFFVLDAQSKTYFEISAQDIQQSSSQGLKAFGAQEDAAGKLYFPDDLFIRTETEKRIGPWRCYQVMTNPKYRNPDTPYNVLWYSTDVDFPVELFGEQLKNMLGDSPDVRGLFDRITRFEGYPVRSEAYGASETIVTTLFKIEKRKNIEATLFEIPRDYKLIARPEDWPPSHWAP